MAKVRMRDFIVLLPGITGSVLQKDGKDLWAISGQAVWSAFTSLGSSIQQLKLERQDTADTGDLGDGIRATRLIRDLHRIPGLWNIDGYTTTSSLITDNFEVVRGSLEDDKPANFFEFPYDWRRDNRVAARLLEQFINRRLPQWRTYSGAADAKVIFLAHSMGGLIARYYLEKLRYLDESEAWRNCRVLITFGTPYRGSVKALNFLANGYKKMFIDLTEMMRSFTSLYQLLPIYEMVKVNGEYQRVAETSNIPGITQDRAVQGLMFHREIEEAVTKHRKDYQYLEHGYKIIPVVGTRQPSLQSAELMGGRLSVSREIPTWIDPLLGDGDGTVPRLSATPIELSDDYRESFFAERHSSLQRNLRVLEHLRERLKQMQVQRLAPIRGSLPSVEAVSEAAISLDLDDLYLASEPVIIRAAIVNSSEDFGILRARIERVEVKDISIEAEFRPVADDWVLEVDDLPPGLYRLEVRISRYGSNTPHPVHDVFEVAM